MKLKITFVILFVLNISFAQVGIGTTTPKKALHIAGATETIRIDGLNNANNTNNLAESGKTYPVHVNEHGDLVIPSSPNIEAIVASNDMLATTTDIRSSSSYGITQGGFTFKGFKELYTHSFTLTRTAFVTINYTITGHVLKTSSTVLDPILRDGVPRIMQSYFTLDKTAGNNLFTGNTELGFSSLVFTGSSATTTSAPSGQVALNGIYTAILEPGTYNIKMFGVAYGGGNPTGTTENSFVFRAGGGTDNLSIHAFY